MDPRGDERRLGRYFESAPRAQGWDRMYDAETLAGVVHHDRQALALEWIDRLGLPGDTPVLDIGCGPGRTAVALGLRGFRVTAIDASAEMLELARSRAADAGLADRVSTRLGDAERLDFDAGTFGLVVALGVLPYLGDQQAALREFARVSRPGGHVVVSSDNRHRVNRLLDPRFTPPLAPIRDFVKARRRADAGPLRRTVPASLAGATRLLSRRELADMVAAAGMSWERSASVGFGPFSFMGRVLLKETAAIRLHRRLQGLGTRDRPVFRSVGLQHLVLARVGQGGPA